MTASSIFEGGCSDGISINKIENLDFIVFYGFGDHSTTNDNHVVWK